MNDLLLFALVILKTTNVVNSFAEEGRNFSQVHIARAARLNFLVQSIDSGAISLDVMQEHDSEISTQK